MDWFTFSYTVLGGVGLFFFGMKMMSDGFQSISGSFIQKAINTLTTNRLLALLVGFLVTAIIQSSSITTVMVVGFVNAGLMSLTQAIGVIFGANIGTTITGWIIALNIGKYALLFLGVGLFPMMMARNDRMTSWGKVIFAFGLVFFGLETMAAAVKPLRADQAFLSLVSHFQADTYISLLGTIAVGCLMTVLVQSSAAVLGITIVMASTGNITFQTACGLVFGENIGTTVSAILASLTANVPAKRAAVAHALFNVIGVFSFSLFFWHYIGLIEDLIPNSADYTALDGTKPYIATHIAASHSGFNIINAFLFLPFVNQLAQFVSYLVRDRGKQPKHLEFLGTQTQLSSALAIEQGHLEIVKFAAMVKNMLIWTKEYVLGETENVKIRQRVLKYETITDSIHREMMLFVSRIMHLGLNVKESFQVNALVKVSAELESLADYCQRIVHHGKKLRDDNVSLPQQTRDDLDELFDIILEFFSRVYEHLRTSDNTNLDELRSLRNTFHKKSNELRETNLKFVRDDKIPPLVTLTLVDIVIGLNRIISHSRAVEEAWTGKRLISHNRRLADLD
ncbi:MAG: Na/Pi cotransporter family protein [Oligoflexales bacterium]